MLRVDFAYRKDSESFNYADVNQLIADMTWLTEQCSTLSGLVGYAWVLEYTEDHRYHVHDVGTKQERKNWVDDFKAGKIDLLFVYNMLLTGFDAKRLKKLYLGRVIRKHASGSTFKEVSGSVLKDINIVLPDQTVTNAFTRIVTNIFRRQEKLELENKQLIKLRDWLLPMLMNGQITVR